MSQIVTTEDEKERTALLKKFIEVARVCIKKYIYIYITLFIKK